MSNGMEDEEQDVSEVVEDAKESVMSKEDSMLKDALGEDEVEDEEGSPDMSSIIQDLISGGGKLKPAEGVVKIDIMGKGKKALEKAPSIIADLAKSIKKGKRGRR